MSLGWKPLLAALAVIVPDEWERSNAPNARSHALMSHAAGRRHAGGALSQADVPAKARGATRAPLHWPPSTGDITLDLLSVYKEGGRTEKRRGRRKKIR